MPLSSLMGIIPVAIGAGVALKVTEAAFDRTRGGCPPPRQGRQRYSSCPPPRRYYRRRTGMGFGNFSNIGL